MSRKTGYVLNLAAVVFLLQPGGAQAQDGEARMLISNKTGHTLSCAARKAGSAATEKIFIRAGDSWSRNYQDRGPRRFKCLSVNSRTAPFNQHWYELDAGGRYSLVSQGDGRVKVVLAAKTSD